jgi:hypothetical protein
MPAAVECAAALVPLSACRCLPHPAPMTFWPLADSWWSARTRYRNAGLVDLTVNPHAALGTSSTTGSTATRSPAQSRPGWTRTYDEAHHGPMSEGDLHRKRRPRQPPSERPKACVISPRWTPPPARVRTLGSAFPMEGGVSLGGGHARRSRPRPDRRGHWVRQRVMIDRDGVSDGACVGERLRHCRPERRRLVGSTCCDRCLGRRSVRRQGCVALGTGPMVRWPRPGQW